jgi:hypothetical protein
MKIVVKLFPGLPYSGRGRRRALERTRERGRQKIVGVLNANCLSLPYDARVMAQEATDTMNSSCDGKFQ